jgi:hypothetical protein
MFKTPSEHQTLFSLASRAVELHDLGLRTPANVDACSWSKELKQYDEEARKAAAAGKQ